MILHIVSFQLKRVPSLNVDLPILISQGVRLFASSSDDDVRALLVGPKLFLILLSSM